jgi:hypothetical protein
LAAAHGIFNLPYIKQSFFTKWFTFAGQHPDQAELPLILDTRVYATTNDTFRDSTRNYTSCACRSCRYDGYVRRMHEWSSALTAEGLPCSAERLEWIFFEHNGGDRPTAVRRSLRP